MITIIKNVNCRNHLYLQSLIDRFIVPDDKVSWNSEFKEYCPPYYDSPVLSGKLWADPKLDDSHFAPKWNSLDGLVNRRSHFMGGYKIERINGPYNPIGRTGLRGRGLLGRWGPNHAADPIITRWKRDPDGRVIADEASNQQILQMVVIQRRDNGMWAIPGGMVDAGETVGQTLRREFMEEAMNSKGSTSSLNDFFSNSGVSIYSGYVDDPRNTDNAWMETVAMHFHDQDGHILRHIVLEAGDDAGAVRWIDLSRQIVLYASHLAMVAAAVQRVDAHW